LAPRKVHDAGKIARGSIVEFIDAGGQPIEGLQLKVKKPDGSTKEETTSDTGEISIESEANGEIEIAFGSGGEGSEEEPSA
jgi:hypothetical protein